jgi:hypothetical protein
MPQVRLDLREADGRLPPVCMCCGAPATVFKTKKMYFWPRWTLFLIILHPFLFWLAAFIFSKKARVRAPFCDRHQRHWLDRRLLSWGSGASLGLVGCGAFAFLAMHESHVPGPEVACFGGLCLLVVWLIVVVIVRSTEIQPVVITKSEVVLKGVAEEFVEAIQEADRARLEAIGNPSWDNEAATMGVQKSHDTAIQEERRKRSDQSDGIRE